MDVRDAAGQPGELLGGIFSQRQVRDVDIGAGSRMIDVIEETAHPVDVVDERQVKRL